MAIFPENQAVLKEIRALLKKLPQRPGILDNVDRLIEEPEGVLKAHREAGLAYIRVMEQIVARVGHFARTESQLPDPGATYAKAQELLAKARNGVLKWRAGDYLMTRGGKARGFARLPVQEMTRASLKQLFEGTGFLSFVRKQLDALPKEAPRSYLEYSYLDYLCDTSFDEALHLLYVAGANGSAEAQTALQREVTGRTVDDFLSLLQNSARISDPEKGVRLVRAALTDPNFREHHELLNELSSESGRLDIRSLRVQLRFAVGQRHLTHYVPYYYFNLIYHLSLSVRNAEQELREDAEDFINPAALFLWLLLDIEQESSDSSFLSGLDAEWDAFSESPESYATVQNMVDRFADEPRSILYSLCDGALRTTGDFKSALYDETLFGLPPHAAYLIGLDLLTGRNLKKNVPKGTVYLFYAHATGHPYALTALTLLTSEVTLDLDDPTLPLKHVTAHLNALINIESQLTGRFVPVPCVSREALIDEERNPFFIAYANYLNTLTSLASYTDRFGAGFADLNGLFTATASLLLREVLEEILKAGGKVSLSPLYLAALRMVFHFHVLPPVFAGRLLDNLAQLTVLYDEGFKLPAELNGKGEARTGRAMLASLTSSVTGYLGTPKLSEYTLHKEALACLLPYAERLMEILAPKESAPLGLKLKSYYFSFMFNTWNCTARERMVTGAYEGLTPEFVEALVRKMPSDPSLAHIGMETWLALAWDKSPFGDQLQGPSGEKATVYRYSLRALLSVAANNGVGIAYAYSGLMELIAARDQWRMAHGEAPWKLDRKKASELELLAMMALEAGSPMGFYLGYQIFDAAENMERAHTYLRLGAFAGEMQCLMILGQLREDGVRLRAAPWLSTLLKIIQKLKRSSLAEAPALLSGMLSLLPSSTYTVSAQLQEALKLNLSRLYPVSFQYFRAHNLPVGRFPAQEASISERSLRRVSQGVCMDENVAVAQNAWLSRLSALNMSTAEAYDHVLGKENDELREDFLRLYKQLQNSKGYDPLAAAVRYHYYLSGLPTWLAFRAHLTEPATAVEKRFMDLINNDHALLSDPAPVRIMTSRMSMRYQNLQNLICLEDQRQALGFTLDGTAYYDIFASELIDDMEHNEDGAFCNLESLFGEGARARFMLRSVTVPVNFEELLFNMGCAAQSGDPLGALWASLDVSYLKAPDLSALVIEKKPEARKTRGRGKGRKDPPVTVTQTVTDKAEAGETQDKNAAPSGEGNEDKSGPGMDGGFLTIDVAQ